MNEDFEDKIDSNESSIETLKSEIEDILNTLGDLENEISDLGAEPLIAEGVQGKFAIHWINPSIEAETDCVDIKTVQQAQRVFSQASIYRDKFGTTRRVVQHGDVLVLMCKNPGEDEETPEESEVFDDSVSSCYFIGMCVENDDSIQLSPEDEDPVLAHTEDARSEDLYQKRNKRHFIAWQTCGGGGDNFAFKEPEFESGIFCIHPDTADATGIKLKFEDREAGDPHLQQNAFVPLLPPSVNCPETGDIDVITDIDFNITESSSVDGCKTYEFNFTPKQRTLKFSGGLLIEKTSEISLSPTVKTISVPECDPCPEDDWPSEFNYTVTVTQTPAQLAAAQAQGQDGFCITENGGSFVLTRPGNPFGNTPEDERCMTWWHPTLSNPTPCDVHIQYKYITIDEVNQTFRWSGEAQSRPLTDLVSPLEHTVTGGTHTVVFRLTW